MKLLLVEDVDKLGWLGDVVEVKDGYARNYLLPQGLATIPSQTNIDALADEKAKRAEALAAKANELGHLFGSVAERDIAENLRQQGFAVQDAMVQMPNGHIKEIGNYDVTLKFAAELTAAVHVVVVSQDETVDAVEEQTGTEA